MFLKFVCQIIYYNTLQVCAVSQRDDKKKLVLIVIAIEFQLEEISLERFSVCELAP